MEIICVGNDEWKPSQSRAGNEQLLTDRLDERSGRLDHLMVGKSVTEMFPSRSSTGAGDSLMARFFPPLSVMD